MQCVNSAIMMHADGGVTDLELSYGLVGGGSLLFEGLSVLLHQIQALVKGTALRSHTHTCQGISQSMIPLMAINWGTHHESLRSLYEENVGGLQCKQTLQLQNFIGHLVLSSMKNLLITEPMKLNETLISGKYTCCVRV